VAWVDVVASGRSLGRSVLTCGDHAPAPALSGHGAGRLAFDPKVRMTAPRFVPGGLLNRWSIRAFNEVWFHRAPARRTGELQSITEFFHPLDTVGEWNRLYGPAGFLQWQCVVPDGAEEMLRLAFEHLNRVGAASFLTVLKRFRRANPGPLSFPTAGWTLALDIPARTRGLAPTLDTLDRLVAAAGGRIYLAKDSRMARSLMDEMYPRLDEWRTVRDRLDPGGVLQSDLGRRLGLCHSKETVA
jgi:decaprenylphospho-beta-D-ribofuranose 2-oxidase